MFSETHLISIFFVFWPYVIWESTMNRVSAFQYSKNFSEVIAEGTKKASGNGEPIEISDCVSVMRIMTYQLAHSSANRLFNKPISVYF